MVECERVAGGRPTMQDHLVVMVLTETLISAESTALTFDVTHTLQLVQIMLYDISSSFCMYVSSSFCNTVIQTLGSINYASIFFSIIGALKHFQAF